MGGKRHAEQMAFSAQCRTENDFYATRAATGCAQRRAVRYTSFRAVHGHGDPTLPLEDETIFPGTSGLMTFANDALPDIDGGIHG
jgi:hypothetical protein